MVTYGMGSGLVQTCTTLAARARSGEVTATEIQAELLSCIPVPTVASARAKVETEAEELVTLVRRGVMTVGEVRKLVQVTPVQMAYLRGLTATDRLRRATVEMMGRYRARVWAEVVRQMREGRR